MTRELEELGGGDARVGRAVACVVASPAIGCQSILQANAGGLIVQDTRSSRGSKTFPLPNFQDNQSLATDTLRQVHAKMPVPRYVQRLKHWRMTGN